MDTRPKIAVVGLGALGRPIARNLVEHRLEVHGYDRNPPVVQNAASDGVIVHSSAAEAAEGCDILITIVRTAKDLEEALCGVNGALEHLDSSAIVMDLSTLSPADSERIAQVVKASGREFLRCAVSGSAVAAAVAGISFICSGERAAFERCVPVLAVAGRATTYVGEGEEARAIKLAINVLVGVGMATLVEAVSLAQGMGVPKELFLEAVASSAVDSPFFRAKAQALIDEDWTPTASLGLMRKDLALIRQLTDANGSAIPLTLAASELYDLADGQGWADRDFASIHDLYKTPSMIAPPREAIA